MSWIAVQLRRLADSRAATGGLMGLALVTSFLFAGAPRVIDAQADVALHSTIDAATSDTRNLSVSQTGRIAIGSPDPLAAVDAAGDQFYEQLPGSVAALLQARYSAIDTPRFLPMGLEGRTVRLRYLQGATDHIRLVAGRLPTGQTSQLAVPPGTLQDGTTALNRPLPPPDSLTTFEVAVSSASAEDLGVHVGDTLELRTDSTDKLAGRSVAYIAISIVGIYDVPDATADYWFADTSLERPQIRSLSSLNQIDDMTVLIAPEAYPSLYRATQDSGLPFRYTWRFEIDATKLRAQSIDSLLTDLRRMESVFLASGTSSAGPQAAVAAERAGAPERAAHAGPDLFVRVAGRLADAQPGRGRRRRRGAPGVEPGLPAGRASPGAFAVALAEPRRLEAPRDGRDARRGRPGGGRAGRPRGGAGDRPDTVASADADAGPGRRDPGLRLRVDPGYDLGRERRPGGRRAKWLDRRAGRRRRRAQDRGRPRPGGDHAREPARGAWRWRRRWSPRR